MIRELRGDFVNRQSQPHTLFPDVQILITLDLHLPPPSPQFLGVSEIPMLRLEEERQRVQDKVDRYKYYPVANIGLTIGW